MVYVKKKNIRLLLVDDDEDYFILTREMLKEIETTRLQLEWAETFEDAIEKIKEKQFDVYLFDYDLGKRNGIDLLKELAVIDNKTPVIMLTGKGDHEIDTAAMKAGASDYINKRHLKPELLERSVRYVIEHKRLLNERVLLLKEINHRVKNNFQLISSILQLESESMSDSGALKILDDCRYRINTISILHEKLYMSDNLVEVSAAGYIRSILEDLFQSFVLQSHDINYQLEAEDVAIGIKQMIHCGIIVNELVSNALKYAFPTGWKGEPVVSIKLALTGKTVNLTVSDNGAGMPVDFNVHQSDSMGLRLVYILSEGQLGGTVTLEREKGTAFHIRFKKA
ncbi:MAG: response regulator [bacterium]|nr:response regulator [bacterium]